MLSFITRKTVGLSVLALAVGLHSQLAEAGLVIEISDGFTTVSVEDGGFGDLSAVGGVVVFTGAVGDFDINVTTGISYPALGSTTSPVLDLDSVNVSSGGTGTLTVKMTVTDFVAPLEGTAFLNAGGTTDGTVVFQSYVDSSNDEFGTADPTGTLGVFSNGAYSGSTFSPTSVTGPYSATIIATITHDDAQDSTTLGADYSIVPEPGSLALMTLGVACVTRRRRR